MRRSNATFAIPISSGILAHCQKIGIAIWVFIWMIDRTTREVITGQGCAEGLVYGKPVRARDIARDLGMAIRTVHAHIEHLIAAGYLSRIDYGEGLPSGYSVVRSKKWKHRLLLTIGEDATDNHADFCGPSQKNSRGFAESCATLAKFSATLAESCSLYRRHYKDITRTTTRDASGSFGSE